MDAAGVVQKAAMPITAFRGAKGFVFTHRRKYGFLFGSYQIDVGFITAKVVNEDGEITWSPPLFRQRRVFGIGPALGYLRGGTCLALLNDEAVLSQTQPEVSAQLRGRFLVDMNGSRIREIQLDSKLIEENVVKTKSGGLLAQYFRLRAMLVELSISVGRGSLMKKKNTDLYGDVSPEDVIAGKIPSRRGWKDGWCSELSKIKALLEDFTRRAMAQKPLGRIPSRTVRDTSASNLEQMEAARITTPANRSLAGSRDEDDRLETIFSGVTVS